MSNETFVSMLVGLSIPIGYMSTILIGLLIDKRTGFRMERTEALFKGFLLTILLVAPLYALIVFMVAQFA